MPKHSSSREMAGILAFQIGTANRDVIFNRILRTTWNMKIQPIRQTLGFRETNDSVYTRPKFVSHAVQNLYNAIGKISGEKLPNKSLENLRRAWIEGKLLDNEINNLIEKYGMEIWAAPMDRRRLVDNPKSHLLVTGEGEGFYTTDLFYDNEDHRAYIKLQLEHMAYAKATHHCNHYNRAQKTDTKPATPARRTSHIRKTIAAARRGKARPSLMAILSLRYTDLLKFPQEAKTRKQSVKDDRSFVLRNKRSQPTMAAVEESDEKLENGYELRSCSRKQRSQPTTGFSEESEEEAPSEYELQIRNRKRPTIIDNDGALNHEERAYQRRLRSGRTTRKDDQEDHHNHNHNHYVQNPQKRSKVERESEQNKEARSPRNTSRLVPRRVIDEIRDEIIESHPIHEISSPTQLTDPDEDSILSEPLEDMLEDAPGRVSNPENQDGTNSRKDQPYKEHVEDHSMAEKQYDAISPPEDESSEKEERTASPELDLNKLRLDLHVLLLGELCHVPGAHSLSRDTNELWEASQEIDLALKLVWATDKNDLKLQLGAEKYQMIDRAVGEWLVWRDMTRKLGSRAGVHPSEGPLPRLSGEQWADMLGGKREFQEMDLRLATYRRFLQTSGSGANKDDFAKLLATAFASVIKYSLGVESFISLYKEDILAFNEKLFSWPLNFVPG